MGIVSFGPDECGKGEYPAVFTRVSSYIPWIKQTMNKRLRRK
jgi:secreted trypsin-like serine protease